MSEPRRPCVTIIGASAASAEVLDVAEAVGRGVVDAGYRLVTGGLTGVMEAASRGARTSAEWQEGRVLGLLPVLDAGAANPWVDIAVPTGLGIGRNLLVVAAGDVVIAIGGGSGTLSELAFAWQLGKPIVALDLGDGWSSELAGRSLDGRRTDAIERAGSAEEAIQATRRILDRPSPSFSTST